MVKRDGNSHNEVFPKVKTDCKISSCKKVKGGVDLRFDDLQITGSQFERVSDWIDDETDLTLTIQQKQGSLLPADEPLLDEAGSKPGRKKKDRGMAATVAETEDGE